MDADTPRLTSESLSHSQASRSAERRRYFVAGAVACLVVQLLVVGGIGLARYVASAVGGRADHGAPSVSSSAETSSPGAALPLPVATQNVAVPAENAPGAANGSASTPAPAPAAVESAAVTTVTPADNVPVATPPASAPAVKMAPSAPVAISIPSAPRTAPPTPTAKPAARPLTPAPAEKSLPLRPGEQPDSSASAAPRVPVIGALDWAESQSELRSALERWLVIEDRDDLRFGEAEVLLGPDGDTARTRVPSTHGGGKIVEQRWERRPNGWVIVGYREITAPKQ